MSSFLLRPTQSCDYAETENLIRDAFWDVYHPGAVEHYVTHRLRSSADRIPQLDLVAVRHGAIVGCLIGTYATVVNDSLDTHHQVVSFGPLGVALSYRRMGIGTALMRMGLRVAARIGFPGAFLYGYRNYYARFGFRDARRWQIATEDGGNFDFFLGKELSRGGLRHITGRLVQSRLFESDPAEVERFDERFPPRAKHVTDTQLE